MQAEGGRFSITPGYGWDGVTWGSTPPDMLLPSLFHDAMPVSYTHLDVYKRQS